ncbi:hypothetical protein CRENBAI_016556 [Crenichthys baileyi]|uniref:Uncharacterized protein n=1 Tax=Crenichthys baileyi TaxID=28760 RepID=A0AAV9S871_9TELE
MTVRHRQGVDQADRATDLLRWIQQQEEELREMYGEEVEILPSPLLLQEMEEVFGGSQLAQASQCMGPGPNRTSASPSARVSSRRRCCCRQPPADQPSTSAAASAQPSSPPPAAAEFRAGFSTYPGRRRRRRPVATEKFGRAPPTSPRSVHLAAGFPRVGGRLPSALWGSPVLGATSHSGVGPGRTADLPHVHSILQAEFLKEGWLDAPEPLSAGGPFAPLLEAVSAAAGSSWSSEPQLAAVGSSEPQPAAAGSSEPQPAATRSSGSLEPQPAAAGSRKPQLTWVLLSRPSGLFCFWTLALRPWPPPPPPWVGCFVLDFYGRLESDLEGEVMS